VGYRIRFLVNLQVTVGGLHGLYILTGMHCGSNLGIDVKIILTVMCIRL
jgi:hypothetical protein